MAREPKSLVVTQIAAAGDNTLSYVVPAATVTSASLVITNVAPVINEVTVIINNGTSDFILARKKLPAGIGKSWRVLEMSDEKLSAGFFVKIGLSVSSAVNVFLSGNEFTEE